MPTKLPPGKQELAFGQEMSKLRNRRGWSQEEFAERADVSSKYIREIEKGRRPGRKVFSKLMAALGVPKEKRTQLERRLNAIRMRSIEKVSSPRDPSAVLVDAIVLAVEPLFEKVLAELRRRSPPQVGSGGAL